MPTVSRSDRSVPIRLVPAAVCLALTATTGCFWTPPTPPDPRLTVDEATVLAKCQATIAKKSSGFAAKQVKSLQGCAAPILSSRLAFENDLITSEQHQADIDKARDKCTKAYESLGGLSTKLLDSVDKACSPVAAALLGEYDSLRFQAAMRMVDGGEPPATFEEFLAGICGLNVLSAHMTATSQFPRLIEQLRYLGDEFVVVGQEASGDNPGLAIAAIPYDSRCNVGGGPTP